jgi:hypothetical protein
MIDNPYVRLHTVEVAVGHRDFSVTIPDGINELQLRTQSDIWHKERALNILIQRLPRDWKYVAWVDADVTFLDPHWAENTLHALQHYDVVQPWSESVDLAPNGESLTGFRSFMWCYYNADHDETPPTGYYAERSRALTKRPYYWHPGFAWAWRRKAYNDVGRWIDWAILGGGDMYMAHGLMGLLDEKRMPRSLMANGARWLREWQNRALKYINKNVGYINGLVAHHWHGKKANRKYRDRGQILSSAKFDPELDLKPDDQGLWQLTDRSPELREGIREYMRQRNEDGIEL